MMERRRQTCLRVCVLERPATDPGLENKHCRRQKPQGLKLGNRICIVISLSG